MIGVDIEMLIISYICIQYIYIYIYVYIYIILGSRAGEELKVGYTIYWNRKSVIVSSQTA